MIFQINMYKECESYFKFPIVLVFIVLDNTSLVGGVSSLVQGRRNPEFG